MTRIAVVISGSGSNLQAIIDGCKSGQVEGQVVGVISNKADAFGLTRAKNADIAAIALPLKEGENRADYDLRLGDELEKLDAELIVLAGFMRILTPEFVSRFAGRLLNIHPSLLPKYTGLNTHQRALDAGDAEHGVSVHFVTEELDGGPVILQAKVPVFEGDDADALAARVHTQEHRIYPMVVNWFCQGRLAMMQGKAELDGKPLPAQGYAYE
ncbi:phosphoribosylglycinamide formyltransferase [Ferrimonas aestuarii]|uniref:Phosphoribosylglycinamide formyltransferase n=1 Tax=Ferrimonas aestuarii TaxID=2569539 RepID=A0A4U1BM07_9GAMM|nr:phosphoribosylglycinamide formyltransferase [Ferrimonas aestuarii]TKB53996.1 phosphoribosylglycinamide formyltransferase [Ferrimonas aestuarii]